MNGGRIRLSQLEYDVLWEHLGLGAFPPVLAVPSPGRTHEERSELRGRAWASLGAKDLGRPNDVDGRLRRWLTALARPERELDARMRLTPHGTTTALLVRNVRNGRTVTAAVLDEDELVLWGADQLVAEAVGLLPAHPAGACGPTSLLASTVDSAAGRAGADRTRFFNALTANGVGRSDARTVTDVLGGVLRLAHFGAARTPAGGERRRASHVVSVYDTPQGRFLFTRKKEWVTLMPGSTTAIGRQLDELLH